MFRWLTQIFVKQEVKLAPLGEYKLGDGDKLLIIFERKMRHEESEEILDSFKSWSSPDKKAVVFLQDVKVCLVRGVTAENIILTDKESHLTKLSWVPPMPMPAPIFGREEVLDIIRQELRSGGLLS